MDSEDVNGPRKSIEESRAKQKPSKWLLAANKIKQSGTKDKVSVDTSDGKSENEDAPLSSLKSAKRLIRTGSEFLEDINNGKYDQWTPELCVHLLRLPNVQNYAGMKKWLENCKKQQMLEFLELDGLGILFEALEKLSDKGFASVADALLQLECVLCVRVVMNSRLGLEYITNHKECCRKLIKGMSFRFFFFYKKKIFAMMIQDQNDAISIL